MDEDESILLLISSLENVLQRGENLPDSVIQELTEIFTLYLQTLTAREAQTQPPIEFPKIEAGQFPSSNVNGFKYDPKKQKLLIQFHGSYPQAEGPIYEYGNVPPYVFKILQGGLFGPKTSGQNRYHRWIRGITPSYGAVVNHLIKAGGFPYQKVA